METSLASFELRGDDEEPGGRGGEIATRTRARA